jgi:hypothetical protein
VESLPRSLPYSLAINVRELGGGKDSNLCGDVFEMIHSRYSRHFQSAGKSLFMQKCANGRAIVVSKAGAGVIAAVYVDEQPLVGADQGTLVVYFAQNDGYMAHGLQGWLMGEVLRVGSPQ